MTRAARGRRAPVPVREQSGSAPSGLGSALVDAVARTAARTRVPGAQVAVRRDGDLLWSAPFGDLGGGTGRGVARGDRFVVASVTKLAVASLTLSLVEDGALTLESPVATWLPEVPNGEAITVRMLLGHRSGLPEYFRDAAIRRKLGAEPDAGWERAELLDAVRRLGPERPPDERFAYRNTNYIALGEVLRRCTGQPVRELVAGRIAAPLGLETFSFDTATIAPRRLAAPHGRRLGRLRPLLPPGEDRLPSHAIGDVWTDGGLATSADELAAFAEALFSGRLVSPEAVDAMARRHRSDGAPVGGILGALQRVYLGPARRGYGLGVAVEEKGGTTTLGHEGMYYGYSATVTHDLGSRTTVAVTTNLAAIPVPAERIERAVRGALSAAPHS